MLSTADIIKKVRELEIISKKNSTHFFSGEYRSAFRGKGMNFREVREYTHGDDIRFIDWNVSARYAHPFTKVFEEERELTIILLVDISASALFGTTRQRKMDLIIQMGALLTFSAINNNDKVGVVFFSDKVEKYIPPKKGRNHALYIVRELLTETPTRKGTNIQDALKFLSRNNNQRCIAFVMSDFLTEGYENSLKVIGQKHDVIGLKVYDKLDANLPNIGMVRISDMESQKSQWLNTSDAMVRYNYHQNFMNHSLECKDIFKKAGADLLHIATNEDYIKILQQFFIKRMKK
ncbi:MAG: DUF58 domain-containing protein [Ginsengibacter sp.]